MKPFVTSVNEIQEWIRQHAQGSCSVYVFEKRWIMTGWLQPDGSWLFE